MSIVEVMAAGFVLVLVALGVFASVDGAQTLAGGNRAHSVSVALAQEDQNRMRALALPRLLAVGGGSSSTRTVAGVPYTVLSEADWVRDSSGTIGNSCTAGGGTDYVHIRSTVSSPIMERGVRGPVRVSSLRAATISSYGNAGNLAVTLQGGAQGPLTGQSVRLTGGAGTTKSTNSIGCAFFPFAPAGAQRLQFSRTGYVDPTGVNAIDLPITVVRGATTTKDLFYDQAGQITANFMTKRAAATGPDPVTQSDRHRWLTLENGNSLAQPLSALDARTLSPPPPANEFYRAQSIPTQRTLFPFSTAYAAYSGDCEAADPTNYGETPASMMLAPGGSPTVEVFEPALNVQVQALGAPLSGARIKVKAASGGCTWNETQTSTAANSATNTPAGALPEPGLPYGDYDVCAEIDYGSNTYRSQVKRVSNKAAPGTTVVPLPLTTTREPCPS